MWLPGITQSQIDDTVPALKYVTARVQTCEELVK